MSSLQGKTLSETYKDLLQISNSNIGVDNTCRYIEDGEGTVSILAISQNYVGIGTTTQGIYEGKLHVSGSSLFSGDIITTGSITFSPGSYTALHTGSNLDSLANVDATVPADGQTLIYNSSTSSWTPSALPASALENLSDTFVDNATLTEGDILEWSEAGMYWRSRSAPASLPSTTTSGAFLTYDTAVNAWQPNTSFINSAGRLGIGTATVTADLHVSHDNATTLRAPMARMELASQSNINFDIFGDTHANLPGWFQIGGWNDDVGIAIVSDLKANVEAGTSRKGLFLKNGNIGVGTTSPQSKLDIYGDNSSLRFTRDEGDRFGELLYDGSIFKIKCPASDRLDITDVSGINALFTVNPNDGKVGIGMPVPAHKLHIADATNYATIRLDATSKIFDVGVGTQTASNPALQNSFYVWDNNAQSTRMVIKSNGWTGFGTEYPENAFHVMTSSTTYPLFSRSGISGHKTIILNPNYSGLDQHSQLANTDPIMGLSISTYDVDEYQFFMPASNGSANVTDHRGRIWFGDSAANIWTKSTGVGQLEWIPSNASRGGFPTFGGALVLANNAASTWANMYFNRFNFSPGMDERFIDFHCNSQNVGYIKTNGTSTSFLTTSDYRLKDQVDTINNSVGRLMQLKPCSFIFKRDPNNTRVEGFLAHEVENIIPQAVSGKKDGTKVVQIEQDGEQVDKTVPDYQAIDASKMVPLLTDALQQAHKQIEHLTQQNSDLESELDRMNSRLLDIENFIGSDNK